jgi:hypothetical protein
MSEPWGGAQGGSQGGREFSPTASLASLPGITCDDAVQGGKLQDRSERPKPQKFRYPRGVGVPPSLPADATDGLQVRSLRVIGEAKVDGQMLAVRASSEVPSLTPPVCRVLLAILVELTTVEILDKPAGKERND